MICTDLSGQFWKMLKYRPQEMISVTSFPERSVNLMFTCNTVDTKIKVRNAFNAMFVDTVDTSVCGSYTTPYTEYY